MNTLLVTASTGPARSAFPATVGSIGASLMTAGVLLVPFAAFAQQQRAPLDVVKEFLENTAPDKVGAAAKRLVAPDATYVSLNFDNPELKKIEPWAGTSKGPEGFSDTFSRVAKYWKIEDFKVTDMFGSGESVAVFGTFTYRSVAVGTSFRSPFSILAKVRNGQIHYFQFMEDTYASAASFRQSGSWIVKTDPDAPAFEVGKGK
ncbi:nuclear transport factor 2 family protein [Massilia sp. CFBP9026]|uniref:nuclear transport factor 2 family protein n=1 Tax=Massilia sp. CFBP9026 TaxID=3096536 RepID=UPI002A69C4F0|nr:nuclear transport factor 2 family protein [Massilia sp. CFBP9026]MDY0963274.1 nuclear transport factor 2 family protein [Massilia sp. CFBP9026]